MIGKDSFRLTERIKSFGYAFQGLAAFLKTQHNAWLHFIAATVVIILGFIFKVNHNEWCFLIIAISFVLIAEMLNTSIEFLCDFVSPEIHPQIKTIKDIAAGAVFIAAITAVAIGLIVFLPKVL